MTGTKIQNQTAEPLSCIDLKSKPLNSKAMITGANHSGFGAYEKPEMDHEALISSSLQRRLAAQMVRMALMGAD